MGHAGSLYKQCYFSGRNEDPEVDDQGNKWSLSAFLRHLKSQGIDTGALMRSVEDVIIKSLLAASYQMNTATNMFVPHSRNCFGESQCLDDSREWGGKIVIIFWLVSFYCTSFYITHK